LSFWALNPDGMGKITFARLLYRFLVPRRVAHQLPFVAAVVPIRMLAANIGHQISRGGLLGSSGCHASNNPLQSSKRLVIHPEPED
jgi:hypothetical protein